MGFVSSVVQTILLAPVVGGSVYMLLCLLAVIYYCHRRDGQMRALTERAGVWPAVTILKPVCGLERGLEENLRSVCIQDYPEHQVVLSVQHATDPALPLLQRIQGEFGEELVSVVVATDPPTPNGKIHNLLNALTAARHDVLVINDSDVRVEADYLKSIVAPLEDPETGFVCTLYRGVEVEHWFERLEVLSLHDFTVNVIFADMTGASAFCVGASIAFRRSTLEKIGGFEPLSDYLIEDFVMGQRIVAEGFKGVLVPYWVNTVVDLETPRAWWDHQVYWDQNTRTARWFGFLATVLVRPVPFALLFAAWRLFDPIGLAVLAGTTFLRLFTSGWILRSTEDDEGLASLAWLPLRDIAALGTWLLAFRQHEVVWRGVHFELTPDGRLIPRDRAGHETSSDR